MRILRKAWILGALIAAMFAASGPAKADSALRETDHRLGPWLDLEGGGRSVGRAQGVVTIDEDGTSRGEYGSLENDSILPRAGDGFISVSSPDESAGAGHLVSLLVNAAADLYARDPGTVLRVADLSHVGGGYSYPPHRSHQNGLDADVLFVGATSWRSVLDGTGAVSARFDFERNWDFWRALVAQKIRTKSSVDSVVSMILVAPEIKTAVCEWALATGRTSLEDLDVLRRLRPTEGHDDHFHLRVRCSPYHERCTGDFGAPATTGC